jgi:hypothetical protein
VLLSALNDREHKNRITVIAARDGENDTRSASRQVAENVLWRSGDDVASLSFVTPMHGWAMTQLGDLLLTTDGGAAWRDIGPVQVPHARSAINPGRERKVKAKLLGPGPRLTRQDASAGLHYSERVGFDEHSVATTAQMGTWWDMSPFFDVGMYIGGANYCGKRGMTVCNSGGKCISQCTSRSDPAGSPPRVTIWGLGSGSNALSDSYFSTNQRAHQFLEDVAPVTYGGVDTGYSIDYDVENLQLAGASGTKNYVWTETVIPPSVLPTAWILEPGAINDVVSGTSPTFVQSGQVGEIVGSWGWPGCGWSCYQGFLDTSGTLTSFSDPSTPNFDIFFGLNDASQVVGFYCYGVVGGDLCWDDEPAPAVWQSGVQGNLISGTFADLNFSPDGTTTPEGINDGGQIIAQYVSLSCQANPKCGTETNLLYANRQFSQLYITCSDDQAGVDFLGAINGSGDIVGSYFDASYYDHPFVYTSNGTCIPLDGAPGLEAYGVSINSQGQVLGAYWATLRTQGWFVLDNGQYYILNSDLDASDGNGVAGGINDAAQITGQDVSGDEIILNPE